MAYFTLNSGFRNIPSSSIAPSCSYSMATHNFLGHNQELLNDTIQTRQLVNDYYPNTGSSPYSSSFTASGSFIATWGPFESQEGMRLRGKLYSAINTSSQSNYTEFYIISSRKSLTPTMPFSSSLLQRFTSSGDYISYNLLTSSNYLYSDITLFPNSNEKKEYYISAWGRANDPTGSSELNYRFLSIWEEPRIT